MSGWEVKHFEIRSRSVEQVLIPLVAQITVLVNSHTKEIVGSASRERLKALAPHVESKVQKLTSIGKDMGKTRSEIRGEMLDACDEATEAGEQMALCLVLSNDGFVDKVSLAKNSRLLLSAIAKILLLADQVAVQQMVDASDKVNECMKELESVQSFAEFVQSFSQFGTDMVALAHISGERQNDLKDERQRAEVCAARSVLEKSTMMLLTTCKACLRHPDSPLALSNRSGVFKSMRNAIKTLKLVIQDHEFPSINDSRGMGLDFQDLQVNLEVAQETVDDFCVMDSLVERLDNITIDLENVINVDCMSAARKCNIKSALTEAKDLTKELRSHLAGDEVQCSEEISPLLKSVSVLVSELQSELNVAAREAFEQTAMEPKFKTILKMLKVAALDGDQGEVEQCERLLSEELNRLQEVFRLSKNVSTSEAVVITATRIEENMLAVLPQLVDAGKMLAKHPTSKITQENLEVFVDVWETHVDELSALIRSIVDVDRRDFINSEEDWLSVYIPMATRIP